MTAIHYEVPGMTRIEQDKSMACWYASAMMVLAWKEANRPDPFATQCRAIDAQTIALYKANGGIQNPQIIPLAKRLGLKPVPPMSPTPEAILSWLRGYGPLWTNGQVHIVVVAGIRGDRAKGYELKVYDPAPGVATGWRSLSGWYAGFDPAAGGFPESTRDASASVEAVFLHA
jgi:hypothetical protein